MSTRELIPKAGDVCVGCVHKPNLDSCHYYFFPEPLKFRPPKSDMLKADWLLLCGGCHAKFHADIKSHLANGRLKIACHLVWPEDKSVAYK